VRSIPRTQLAVMRALLGGRAHAYEIKRRLAPEVGHSSVYAALAGAETKGYVTSEWEDPTARPPGSGPLRKYHELTAVGSAALRAQDSVAEQIDTPRAPVPAPGISEATT